MRPRNDWAARRRAPPQTRWERFRNVSTFWLAVTGTVTGTLSFAFNVWEHRHIERSAIVSIARVEMDESAGLQPAITFLLSNDGNQNIAVQEVILVGHQGSYEGPMSFYYQLNSRSGDLPLLLLPGQIRPLRLQAAPPVDLDSVVVTGDLFYAASVISIDVKGERTERVFHLGTLSMYDLKQAQAQARRRFPLPTLAAVGMTKAHVWVFRQYVPKSVSESERETKQSLFRRPDCSSASLLQDEGCDSLFGSTFYPDSDHYVELCDAHDDWLTNCQTERWDQEHLQMRIISGDGTVVGYPPMR